MNTWGEKKGSMFFFSSSKLWNPIAAGRKRKEKERKQERENRETEVAVMRSNLWNSSSWKFRFCCFSPSPLVFRLEDMITSTSIYGTFIFFNSFFFFFSIIPNVVCYCCLFVMFGEKKSKREEKKKTGFCCSDALLVFLCACLAHLLKVVMIDWCRDEGHVVWLIILYIFFSGIINYCKGCGVFFLLCVQVQLSFSLHCFSYSCMHSHWQYGSFVNLSRRGCTKISTLFCVLCDYSATNVVFVRCGP